ncbi:uncharacterized protein LOC18433552 [Amborella trichopoda]|uniref:Fe2OG dioxygenase domain-containing protein n=1 Tax=Amborella trichopoda TaxID=13333 RepID=W1PE96_AMBTC|nr:uncharacterized protein LOC18433552 [Amborella trichopoda]ERN05375.1 hypothetical protein AMTR_s00007p00207650 [Amborella trichopoda]|eukprot:XP_006843700.1 uncharacterized protein LOC18433552 [Amborella trichopoda]
MTLCRISASAILSLNRMTLCRLFAPSYRVRVSCYSVGNRAMSCSRSSELMSVSPPLQPQKSADSASSSSGPKIGGCLENESSDDWNSHEKWFSLRNPQIQDDYRAYPMPTPGRIFSPKRVVNNDLHNETSPSFRPFNICYPEMRISGRGTPVKLNASLFTQNKQKRMENECLKNGIEWHKLGPGMILLKSFLGHDNQIEIVRICQKLGAGPGGFYQPGYSDGAKLRLKMMCLGKNWNPQTSAYEDTCFDGSKPPDIPNKFKDLVLRAITSSHELLKQENRFADVKKILPSMTPDLCIVNFYRNTGCLGLHQDKDESKESIGRGLPVVSFSIGDSGDFLYGKKRDEKKASRIKLESGDVLIFGGKSRDVFHGVPCIHRDTMPNWLRDESRLFPGRLNLTFRKY